MKLMVIGDIHGNIVALEKALQSYLNEVDQVICHGDVVNYGPWGNECVDLLQLHNVQCLLGNHEEAYINGRYEGHNEMVQQFFAHTLSDFDRMDIIKSYDKKLEAGGFLIRHTINNTYYYPDTNITNLTLKSHTVIGHSHYPFIKKTVNSHFFINTGSVGQNRKDLSIINFAIIDTNHFLPEIISLKYDPLPLIKEMEQRCYPKTCINYYKSKLI
ncbi:MAG: metallophosphoesterase [Nonlabens sp.]